jgi:hypothetical protein
VFQQFIHLVVGNIAVFEDKSLADEVIGGVVQVLGQKAARSIGSKRGSFLAMMCCSTSCILPPASII